MKFKSVIYLLVDPSNYKLLQQVLGEKKKSYQTQMKITWP